MKLWLSLTIALVLCATPIQAKETQLSFVADNWAPYTAKGLPDYGITAAIVTAACKRVGLQPEFHFQPWTRGMKETKTGKFDAMYNAYISDQRARDYAFSEPYFQTQLVLCTKADTDIQYDGTVKSLLPYRLGVVRNYVNTVAIDSAENLQKDEAESDVLNMKKLIHGRVDLIVIDKYQALHLIKNNPTIEAEISDIKFLSPELERKPLHVMFSSNRPNWKENLKLFNQGLREIKRDGTLNDLMLIFGISVPYLAE